VNKGVVLEHRARRAPGVLSAEAKLAFAEGLLACRDLVACAQLVVDFVVRQPDASEALVAAPAPESDSIPALVGLAGHGLAASRVSAMSIALDDRDHPLVAAMLARQPSQVELPDGSGRYLALPLIAGANTPPSGLLLVAPVERATPDLVWTARVTAQKLERLLAMGALGDAERSLARERALLQSLLSAIPDPVLLTDPEGRLRLANPRAELYFASQDNESEGRRRAVALNNMLFSAGLSRRAFEDTEDVVRRELPLVDPSDGSDRLFELLSAIIATPDGPGMVSVLRNVTDLQIATQEIEDNYRKLRIAEAEIRSERDRLDLVIDSVADPIVVSDPNGAIVMMNTPAEHLFTAQQGAPAEELQRVRSNDAHFSSHVSNLLFGTVGTRFRGELGLVDPKSGIAMPVEAISGKILAHHGELSGIVTILHDRSEALEKARLYEQLESAKLDLEEKVREATAELVRQNELLRRQHIELEQASTLKSQFLANMSHEFRTPLNAILGYTSMLLKGVNGELTASQGKNLTRVDSNAKHLLAIINDILDISRIEAGKMPVHVATFDVRALIAEVVAEVDPLIPKNRVGVSADLKGRIPPMTSDRAKVKQILVNLLSNALKFTPQGAVNVSAVFSKGEREVWISVADTGIGIARRDHEHIFADFRQADNSPTRQYGGAGLGLSICRRLASVLGGRITLASAVGKGSTFTLVLPARWRSASR
jgi:signal transduction histidine kinase